ncbi:MAG: hypothetical protein GXO11_03330, partial [Epsilonproteobacteria bacterium]|nr:hypothetical protein [Campylobacterota bacterium]
DLFEETPPQETKEETQEEILDTIDLDLKEEEEEIKLDLDIEDVSLPRQEEETIEKIDLELDDALELDINDATQEKSKEQEKISLDLDDTIELDLNDTIQEEPKEQEEISLDLDEEIQIDLEQEEDFFIDKEEMIQKMGIDEATYNELLKEYIADMHKGLEELKQSVIEGDSQNYQQLLLKLKGMSDTMLFESISKDFETLLSGEDIDRMAIIETIYGKVDSINRMV